MLFLLRQIRRKLLTDNKVGTYILYAIGEIVLVVVGILIAVNIDDWNESNKRQTKEEAYLQRLKEEALWNIDALDERIKSYQKRAARLDSVATLLSQDAPKHNAPSIPVAPYFVSSWRLRNSAYAELVSTGTLGILRDETLRELLDETASFESQTIKTLNYWRDLSIADIQLFQPYREKIVTKSDTDTIKSKGMTLNYEQMIGDSEAIGGLYYWSDVNYAFAEGISEFRDSYFKILERINCLESKTCEN